MIQEVMPYIGIALQWARAQKRFADGWYILIVAAASAAMFAVASNGKFAADFGGFMAGWWEQAKGILAFTQLTSSTANMVDSATKGRVPTPITDSQ